VSRYPSRPEDQGKTVNIGVRSEGFVEATGDDLIFHGTVDITEALGEVTLLYCGKVGEETPVIAKLSGIHNDLWGREVRLTADPGKLHVFLDGQSMLYRDRPNKRIKAQPH
jgi:alpha-glucoside transport system ATP-binding protein